MGNIWRLFVLSTGLYRLRPRSLLMRFAWILLFLAQSSINKTVALAVRFNVLSCRGEDLCRSFSDFTLWDWTRYLHDRLGFTDWYAELWYIPPRY